MLTENGIEPRRKADMLADFKEKILGLFGSDFDVSDDSDLIRSLSPIFDELDSIQQLAVQAVDSFDERSSTGFALESICRITGTQRDPGARSTGTITITGDASTAVASGFLVANAVTGKLFRTVADVVLPDTGAGAGAETVDANVESVEIGPIAGAIGSLTDAVTIVSGVTSVTNAAAVQVGAVADSDPALRVRRRNELQSGGTGTPGAIFAAVSAVENVQGVVVINNNTDSTDSNGVPARSMRVVVFPTLTLLDDIIAVAKALSLQETAGLSYDGTQEFNVAKADGQITKIRYSYATEVDTRYQISITKNAQYPSNGDDLVRDQILKYFGLAELSDTDEITRWQPGQDINLQIMMCDVLKTVPGITTLTVKGDYVANDPPLLTTVIPMSSGEVGVISDTNNVEVTS